jgi:hypothetical protein
MNLYVLNHRASWGSLFLFLENYLQLYSPMFHYLYASNFQVISLQCQSLQVSILSKFIHKVARDFRITTVWSLLDSSTGTRILIAQLILGTHGVTGINGLIILIDRYVLLQTPTYTNVWKIMMPKQWI